VTRAAFDPAAIPLVAALRPLPPETGWGELAAAVATQQRGLVFTIEHPVETEPEAVVTDVTGVLTEAGIRTSAIPVVARALADVQHPSSRLATRRLQFG
jgi:hypothetical protein